MDESTFGKELQNLSDGMTTECFVGAKRQLERRTLQVADEDMDVVGIHQPLLGWLVQEVLRMVDDELIERHAGRDHHCNRHSAAASGTSDALPGRRDSPGVTGKHRDIETADIDPKLQGVSGHHAANSPVSQAALDLTPLIRQIAAAIPDDGFLRRRSGFDSRLQVAHKYLGHQPAIGKDNRRDIPLQERRRNLLGLIHVRAPNAELLVHHRRVIEENVLLC